MTRTAFPAYPATPTSVDVETRETGEAGLGLTHELASSRTTILPGMSGATTEVIDVLTATGGTEGADVGGLVTTEAVEVDADMDGSASLLHPINDNADIVMTATAGISPVLMPR